MPEDLDQGGEAPCWAHLVDDLDDHVDTHVVGRLGDGSGGVVLRRSNTILYCDPWAGVVEFYRTGLGLQVTSERDWFVEFALHTGSHVSVADATRTSIVSGDGAGVTLSWQVDDVDATRSLLVARDIAATPIEALWGARSCFTHDPAGNRIEFWSET